MGIFIYIYITYHTKKIFYSLHIGLLDCGIARINVQNKKINFDLTLVGLHRIFCDWEHSG